MEKTQVLELHKGSKICITSIETRSEAAARKAGNVYTARPVCDCGYRGKWTGRGHAEDLFEIHDCNK